MGSEMCIRDSVYAERFPNETPKLLKHAEIVRDMASSGIVTWQTYDKQIRMDRQVRGTSWGKDQCGVYSSGSEI